MSILKIRDENGNIHPIAIMKGDKGDGVPDGGTKGQVIKKTADGTEWGDTGVPDNGIAGQVLKKTESGTEWGDVSATSKCEALFTNTDVNIVSCAITRRGLYQFKFFYSTSNTTTAPEASSYNDACRGLISISDLNEEQKQRFVIGSYTYNDTVHDRNAYITYKNQTLTSDYTHAIVQYNGSSVSYPTDKSNRSYLAEVRLIIPYD